MYLDFFELSAKPFQITTDPKFLWLGEKHKEALATLHYGILDNRGFLLLTGEVGTGKTILVNRLISSLDSDTIVTSLPDPDLGAMDFYRLLADGLKMDEPFSGKGEFLIHFRKFLHQSHTDRKQVLLIIDECQRLSPRLMEDIRVLSNIEMQDRKLINIFFVGQPEFSNILMNIETRALSQRITVRYHIPALDQQETSDYVNHRLRIAGSKKPIFKITALNEIYQFSGGIPRLINILCDHALLTAFSQNLKQVDANIVKECAEELRIPDNKARLETATLKTGHEAHPDGEPAIETDHAARFKTVDKRSHVSVPESRGGVASPQSSIVWKMSYLVIIVLLLAILGVVITQYVSSLNRPAHNNEQAALNQKTNPAVAESERSNPVSQVRPAPSAVLPLAEIPASGNGSVREVTKADSKTKDLHSIPNAPESETSNFPDNSQVRENEVIAVVSKTEALPEIQAVPPDAEQLEPLALMKDKAIIPFDINSNEISGQAYDALDRIALFMSTHPSQKIIVRGYTDTSGSAGYNETVSEFRAYAVKSYLIGKGSRAENIATYAMGAFNPLASNDTLAGRRKNRRVEIEFVDDQKSNR